MLKGISKIISPELIKILMEMGHGDEIVIADGNFPAESKGQRVVRLDGHKVPEVLSAILKLFPLDSYVDNPVILMETTVKDKDLKPQIWDKYNKIVNNNSNDKIEFKQIDRFDFYKRAEKAYAVIATGEMALYANIILKKGIITD
ncbi:MULTISPECIES: L-fucose mutarotase [Halanaerobium]|jgi:L-fucose mutarotase|uniref:L-fucose mutarotase n=1 Tax=Halanaerobium kushneri TaxID=56779 RepID=A0A1N6ZHZ7_9FIRM|nr:MULTISPECIES: L-fucose mutarotase [Halanaerobium]RCW60340.1 L-fucose mutarotase [Halanaerobium sp. ST460_2HS_T2]SIR26520.1 L-fucose mutarotase [Halanaerobium kushneri]